MDKALADIPVGKEISSSSPPESWKKNSAKYTDYYKVPEKGWKGYDYSHVLKPELRDNGYSLNVYHNDAPRKDVIAVLKHKDKKIGHAVGHVVSGVMELGTEHATEIFDPMHTSKGLGVSMYEGVMAHAKNVLGAKKIRGGAHSTSASFVHRAISKKHDMDYEPDPNIYGDYGEKQAIGLKERGHDLSFLPEHKKAKELYDKIKQSPHDDRFAGYQYALKAESMKKALADIPVGKQIGTSYPEGAWNVVPNGSPFLEPFHEYDLRDSKGWKSYDYSHVLKPEHQNSGYSLTIHTDDPTRHKKAVVAVLKHKDKKVGHAVGLMNYDKPEVELGTEHPTEIFSPLHRGKGLGVAMYEGIMSHAKNVLGAKIAKGYEHSTSASNVHSAIAKKHGMNYQPERSSYHTPIGPHDNRYRRYEYALKSEELDKALADIPVGNQISSSPPREHWSPLTTNNFAQMTGRSSKGWKGYDYSHVLKPELKDKGYTLTVHHDNPHENVGDKRFYKKALVATVKHKGKKIGNSVGYLHDNGSLELATEFASHINPLHRGKGLGVSMYEGIMSHSKNALNGKQVVGGVHSSMASRVHSALAKKHGLDYAPVAQENDKPTGEYDDKFGAYNYALKSEELNKALADIPTGRKISAKEHSYSHVLSPEHIKQGYSLSVLNDNGKIFSTIKHNGKAVGNVYGSTHEPNTLDLSSGFASHLADEHQNKGLGTAMYEALFAHAHNNMGINKVIGGKHSTSASKVHSKIAAKHGLDYTPQLNPEATMSDAEYNSKVPRGLSAFSSNVKYGPYSYTLKSETIVKRIQGIQNLLSKSSIEDTRHEFKEGTLHSGSKKGPKVTSKDQAIAIALNQKHTKSEHTWRDKPILKDKDAQDLDQTTTAYALKLGDTKKAEEKAYNEYQRNHRLDAAAHHYKALGMALAKCNQNAAAHHRLAYQGHMQALGLNGLESPPRVIMERIRQMVDNEQFRFKAHPADIF